MLLDDKRRGYDRLVVADQRVGRIGQVRACTSRDRQTELACQQNREHDDARVGMGGARVGLACMLGIWACRRCSV